MPKLTTRELPLEEGDRIAHAVEGRAGTFQRYVSEFDSMIAFLLDGTLCVVDWDDGSRGWISESLIQEGSDNVHDG